MRGKGSFALKKPKLRQSWNKYNLYNLSRAFDPRTANRTFFQQKWKAKSAARAYHGEKVTEGHWERAFSRRLRAVVPMDASYLAQNDGSNESAGRGSGLDNPEGGKKRRPPNTPYMQMTFAPLERRLDTCIFRAMFASSARQARQFVVHGHVTVNGKKMRYPGYLLNPSDMFQVDPELVLFATGASKNPKERRAGRIRRRMGPTPTEDADKPRTERTSAEEEAEEGEEGTKKEEEKEEDPRKTLKSLMTQAQGLLSSGRDSLPAKRKQDLRAFRASVRRLLSRSGSSAALTENLESQFTSIRSSLMQGLQEKAAKEEDQRRQEQQRQAASAEQQSSEQAAEEPTSAQFADQIQQQQQLQQSQQQRPPPSEQEQAEEQLADEQPQPSEELTEAFAKASLGKDSQLPTDLSESDAAVLERALFQLHHNPIDSSKPYATPWRPRDYMSAFAFIPRYLEVNQNVCAAVYLRHPVARPGVAEIPTPLSEQINGTAFAWYLRRR